MNKRELNLMRTANWKKYHTPSMANYCKRKRNAVFISPANSLIHEQAKLEVCWLLRKLKQDFITEAVRNSSGVRVDIVSLDTGQEIEIVHKHGDLKRYEKEDVVIIFTDKDVKKQLDKQLNI